MSLLAVILIILLLALLWPAVAVSKLFFILIAIILIFLILSLFNSRGQI